MNPTSTPPQSATLETARHVLSLQRVKSASGPLEPAFLAELAAAFQVQTFVETGTYLGNTTEVAVASKIFCDVYTIELGYELAEKARNRFATNPRVKVYHGDSAKLLGQILDQLSGPALFWLNGYYREGATTRGQGNTPILGEIAAIAGSGRKDATILINDLRLFERRQPTVDATPSLHGYPAITEVYDAVREIDPGYQLFVYGDVAIAFPGSANVTVSPLIMALTISRLFDGNNLPVEEVIAAETLIAQANETEREILCEFPALAASTEQHGLGLHYRLWRGHVLLGQKKFRKSQREFTEILQPGFMHWRFHWYLAVAAHGAGDYLFTRTILRALIETVPNFAPAQELLQKLKAPAVPACALSKPAIAPPLPPQSGRKFQESKLAHKYLDGLTGLEIGGSAHNPFGLKSRNVDYCADLTTVFKLEEVRMCGEALKVDIVAPGDELPLPDNSEDFVISSHVIEHFFDPIKSIKEWLRVVRPGGYVFIIAPHKERTFDYNRTRTSLQELLDRHSGKIPRPAVDTHEHYSVWITEDLLDLCRHMQWKVVGFQDADDKVGNGFTLVIQKAGDPSAPAAIPTPAIRDGRIHMTVN